jgi:hypothetical protein
MAEIRDTAAANLYVQATLFVILNTIASPLHVLGGSARRLDAQLVRPQP